MYCHTETVLVDFYPPSSGTAVPQRVSDGTPRKPRENRSLHVPDVSRIRTGHRDGYRRRCIFLDVIRQAYQSIMVTSMPAKKCSEAANTGLQELPLPRRHTFFIGAIIIIVPPVITRSMKRCAFG
jgi:hypothetical protein